MSVRRPSGDYSYFETMSNTILALNKKQNKQIKKSHSRKIIKDGIEFQQQQQKKKRLFM